VSSAILYLAIIAIWAGFLIPAWVRRPHSSHADSQSDVERGDYADDELSVEYVTETENDVDAALGADVHVEVTHRDRQYRAYQYFNHEYSAHRYSEHEYLAAPHGEPGQFEYARGTVGPDQAEDRGYADYPSADDSDAYDSRDGSWDEEGPSQSREQMLRARRRMLTILVTMTLVTGGFTALHVVSWWICVPPTALLVLYVLLLREVALADAELARKRADWEATQARAYRRYLAAQAEREAYEAAQAAPGAKIIDISGRVTDQLYDQYADAAVRAVGD
jgi:hypothetical protein